MTDRFDPSSGESRMTADALARAAGISLQRLESLRSFGLVEPVAGTEEFSPASAVRLRRMIRIHGDLGLSLAACAILVDLLDRLEELESELTRARGGP